MLFFREKNSEDRGRMTIISQYNFEIRPGSVLASMLANQNSKLPDHMVLVITSKS